MVATNIEGIMKDAELISIMGRIGLEWDEIEIRLWYLFDCLLGTRWDFSYAIYYSQQNHRARRDMIEALAATALNKQSARFRSITAIIRRVKGAAKKRNDLTHGMWDEIMKSGKMDFRRVPIKRDYLAGPAQAYSRADLKRLKDQLIKLHADLHELAYPTWHRKNYPSENASKPA